MNKGFFYLWKTHYVTEMLQILLNYVDIVSFISYNDLVR
ncbi:hypothetical protein ADO05_00240 [Streptococcus parauberis]|uniref:Uncharacterized protein n=1 Tax=Streptococcus parauberis NCFD 2020 TaxID=873447 RepID=F1YZC1_9STRE|nr:hypothetical protein SPB_0449 [Streptococcus parauberis NCFD 2020]EMF49744.1 hypothetical protein SPJ2_0564 [Streptococcus parauberis KRS-02109]PIO79734.1 hypothetical protein ADO05_00240 [Streptococcus parauberis]POS67345.1 hypothetical protein AOS90_01123 [Streptococcus parauberis]